MSILINERTRLVVQGITGGEGLFHTRLMKEYGTNVVAGVTPGKGGQDCEGIPVFDTVAAAVRREGVDTSVIFVPCAFAADAVMEAADAGIKVIVCITEGIPALQMATVSRFVRERGACLIGPNCPGVISPGKCKVGIMPGFIHSPGTVGVISRSGTLTYEIVDQLTRAGLGQSTCIGIGGDPVIGSDFISILAMFRDDPETSAIVMIGEIGGDAEERAAAYIKSHIRVPVVSFIAGRTAPPGRRMGHAGAIISGGKGTAADKIEALRAAGIMVAENPAKVGDLVVEALHA
ncbi:succinate--CoA ligase subunit alpha [bacterium]|nr:succinate--CoA ligase subunit alpha [candidate division CSSED10-310 bacterium]